MRVVSFIVIAALATCTAADVQAPRPISAQSDAPVWTFDSHRADLAEKSCPNGTRPTRPQPIEIKVIQAERGSDRAREKNLSGMTLAGAWQLESLESNFGGLSGLAVLPSGELLAVSDAGTFIWISLDRETQTPDGTGAIGYMRASNGHHFPTKAKGDAEGLSYRDGLALVSFEQDHRIDAFALARCGTAARAANIAQLDKVIDGGVLQPNRGAEAVTLVGDELFVGFERRGSGGSPTGQVRTDGVLTNVAYTDQASGYLMTGMDHKDGTTARVFRAYDPVRGARVILQVEDAEGERATANLKQPLPVDNFEGVAIGTSASNQMRIWIISDDNFSGSQRTLLLALDLDQ